MQYGRTREKSVTPTIGTDAYTAGDVVGGLLTFALNELPGGGGVLKQLRIVDADSEGAAGTLYLFNQQPTAIADDAAFAAAMTAADLQKKIATVAVAADDYVTLNSMKYIEMELDVSYFADGALYGYFVCTDTPTYGDATDLTFTLVGWPD